MILATGSQYYLKLLKEEWEKDKEQLLPENRLRSLQIPKPYPTAFDLEGHCHHDIVNRILKFIYHNNEFDSIKHEIHEENIA